MVRRLRRSDGLLEGRRCLRAMLSCADVSLLCSLALCAITILYEMVVIDPS